MARREIRGSRMLITGASSGIGEALAIEAASLGAEVALVARSQQRLDAVIEKIKDAGGQAIAIGADITAPEDRKRMLDTVAGEFGGLDILVNNAGIGATGHFFRASEDRLRRIMEVNFFGPAELMRAAIPLLQQGTNPMVVNVGSILGRRAMPGRSEYSASKFALTGLSEALRAEFTRFDIDLLVVQPGLTVTPFEEHMIENKAIVSLHKGRAMTAETLAQKMLRAMEKGKFEMASTFPGKALIVFNRFFPRMLDRITKRIARRIIRRESQRSAEAEDHSMTTPSDGPSEKVA